jgi:hypothetical protein
MLSMESVSDSESLPTLAAAAAAAAARFRAEPPQLGFLDGGRCC